MQNTFQVVVISDGVHTFTIFTYMCGDLNSEEAVVGFYGGGREFENLQLTSSLNLACHNAATTGYTNVVYQLNPLTGPHTQHNCCVYVLCIILLTKLNTLYHTFLLLDIIIPISLYLYSAFAAVLFC